MSSEVAGEAGFLVPGALTLQCRVLTAEGVREQRGS